MQLDIHRRQHMDQGFLAVRSRRRKDRHQEHLQHQEQIELGFQHLQQES